MPLYLVNARLSERSAEGYARVESLARPMLAALAGVAAQAVPDARRLAALGAPAPVVTGNLKFDLVAPADANARAEALREWLGASRPVFVAASTRDGEESLILDALAADPLPDRALTVIVPRHPQRFDTVAEILRARRIPFVRRSAGIAGVRRTPTSCSATRWASCSRSTRPRTSRSSAAACCRSAART